MEVLKLATNVLEDFFNLTITTEKDNIHLRVYEPPSLLTEGVGTVATEIVDIIITAKDFNGNDVSRNNLVLTCDKGYFLNPSNQPTDTLYFNINGTKRITYIPDEYGTVTFKCEKDNKQIGQDYQLQVQSYHLKAINTTQGNSPRYLTINHQKRSCMLSYYFKGQTITTSNASVKVENSIIPVEYRPLKNVRVPHYRPDIVFTLTTDGEIYVRTSTNNATPEGEYVRFDWTY